MGHLAVHSRKLTGHCKPAIMEKIKIIVKKKDPTLSLLWLGSLLCSFSIPWPGNFHIPPAQPKKKKKKKKIVIVVFTFHFFLLHFFFKLSYERLKFAFIGS